MKTQPLISTAELANRDFKLPADRWFHIAPLGTFPHPSGAMQVIDAEACQSMANRFDDEAKQPNFPGLLVDFDHHSNDPSQPTTAAGWITKIENRTDGLWAQVRWSDLGEQALTGGRYRLTSPVWNRQDCDAWTAKAADDKEHLFLRPRRLDRVALTNDPNLTGMVPLSNRGEEVAPETAVMTQRAATRKPLLNYGTSEGARKGWETRRGGGGGRAATKAGLKKAQAAKSPTGGKRAATKKGFKAAQAAKAATPAKEEVKPVEAAKPPPLPVPKMAQKKSFFDHVREAFAGHSSYHDEG